MRVAMRGDRSLFHRFTAVDLDLFGGFCLVFLFGWVFLFGLVCLCLLVWVAFHDLEIILVVVRS